MYKTELILADVNTSIEKGTGATATATINAGSISEYVITASGSNYTTAPTVTVTGDGTGAQAVATVHNGSVIAVTATQVGSGYTTATVTLTSPEIGGRLPSAIQLAIVDNFTEQDGYIDNKKVKIAPMMQMKMACPIIISNG